MIAPSENATWQLTQWLKRSTSGGPDTTSISAWNVHRILIADSLKGWGDYMASLEVRLREQTEPIVIADVGRTQGITSPLLNFDINFEDRQELKRVEDYVLDVQIILPTILQTIIGIQKESRAFCQAAQLSQDEQDNLEAIIDEFDEYAKDIRMHIDRASILGAKAASTARLVRVLFKNLVHPLADYASFPTF